MAVGSVVLAAVAVAAFGVAVAVDHVHQISFFHRPPALSLFSLYVQYFHHYCCINLAILVLFYDWKLYGQFDAVVAEAVVAVVHVQFYY